MAGLKGFMPEETNQLRVRLVTPERTLFDHPAAAVDCLQRTGTWRCSTGTRRWWPKLGAGDVIVHGRGGADGEAGGAEGVLRWNVSWALPSVGRPASLSGL